MVGNVSQEHSWSAPGGLRADVCALTWHKVGKLHFFLSFFLWKEEIDGAYVKR